MSDTDPPVLFAARRHLRVADIALLAGVSTATVSRVVNGRDRVSDEIRQRVNAAIKESGWVPNASAIALATNRTRTVGAIMPTLDHQNFARVVENLQAKLSEARYNLLLSCTNYDREAETGHVRTMLERGVEAIVLVGGDHPKELLDLLDQRHLPHVMLYVAPGAMPDRQVVGFDNFAAFSEITEYLLGLGHRSFGMIAQSSVANDRARSRQLGVRTVLEEHGLAVRPAHFIEGNWRIEDGYRAFERLMAATPRPTAIICGNDYLALGCLIAAQRMGISIPDEVSVTGFDDVDQSQFQGPGLTTMRVPDADVGTLTGQYLVDVLEGREATMGRLSAPQLILRGSTGAPRHDGK